MKTIASIKDGEIDIDIMGLDSWARKQKDGDYTVEIKRLYKSRSLQENSYYHGVIIKILSDELGYTEEEMQYALKEKFIDNWEDDNGLKQIKETKTMDTRTFEEYLSNIRRWASADLGIYIPLPGEMID